MRPDTDEYLGVDAGAAMVGIARGSGRAKLAEPLMSVEAGKAAAILASLAGKNQAAGIVIGLPRGLDGQETAQTAAVRQWAQQIKKAVSQPLYWQDEALTTRQAASSVNGKQKTVNGPDEHALAAAIILQDFLDAPVNDRVAV